MDDETTLWGDVLRHASHRSCHCPAKKCSTRPYATLKLVLLLSIVQLLVNDVACQGGHQHPQPPQAPPQPQQPHNIFHQPFAHHARRAPPKCGYEACNPTRPGMINVHIVCHTHLDTGWVETYDDYYYRYVQRIYDSVTSNLAVGPDRKFIAVETSYFSRWYNEQNETVKSQVHALVDSGQLEFTSGGWSMADEATPHYSAVVDMMTLGHQWLNATFGECGRPKVAWQIDPFGHSREYASLMSKTGMDGMFIGRIDFQDKVLRERTLSMEMIWKASPSLGNKADLFTGVLPNVYWPPTSFCFDRNCFDEQLHEQNEERRAREFIAIVKKQRESYATDDIIITMGMDFYFRDARKWFLNLDRLMAVVNSLSESERVHLLYSTPACYLKSLHNHGLTWPVKLDDFFPYADAYNTFWTGYFTSRPALKFHIMEANKLLQSGKQLAAFSMATSPISGAASGIASHGSQFLSMNAIRNLGPLKDIMGIMMHHDATTGTCKQFVNDDYNYMISNGERAGQLSILESYAKLLSDEGILPPSGPAAALATQTVQTLCSKMNSSECHPTERIEKGEPLIVRLYNPYSHSVAHKVQLPVRGGGFRVRDTSGALIPVQVIPIHQRIKSLPDRLSIAQYDLVFAAILPPMGFDQYLIEKIDETESDFAQQMSRVVTPHNLMQNMRIGGERFGVIIEGTTGLLKGIDKGNGRIIPVHQNFFWYKSESRFSGEKPSGAYALNPSHFDPHPVTTTARISIVQGALVDEIHQTFADWLVQTIRVHKDREEVEFDWTIGPIPVTHRYADGGGKEIITRFMTDFANNGTFFTDANGRETIRRVRNYRPTWNLDTTELVGGNYYPVTGWIFVRDYSKDLQLTLLPDRSVGGTSLVDGTLELLLHRRLLFDDGFGMEEALNEPGVDGRGLVVRGKHTLLLDDIMSSVRKVKHLARQYVWRPVETFMRANNAPTAASLTASRAPFVTEMRSAAERIRFVGLNRQLPRSVHIPTLEPWVDSFISSAGYGGSSSKLLLRLEHIYEVNEDSQLSRPTQISLRNLFTPFRIVSAQEVTLTGMRDKIAAERERLTWRPQFDPYENYSDELRDNVDSSAINQIARSRLGGDPLVITLRPMELRTFLVDVEVRRNCPSRGFNVPHRPGTQSDDC